MVGDHAEEATGREQRVHPAEIPGTNPRANVAGEGIVIAGHMDPVEPVRKPVILERAKQKEPAAPGVIPIATQNIFRNRCERPRGRGRRPQPAPQLRESPARPALGVEDGPVKVLLVGEMTEEDGFIDTGMQSNFPGGGALESLAGKQVHGRRDHLSAAPFGREPGGAASHCK